jgi:hypothetical protein
MRTSYVSREHRTRLGLLRTVFQKHYEVAVVVIIHPAETGYDACEIAPNLRMSASDWRLSLC